MIKIVKERLKNVNVLVDNYYRIKLLYQKKIISDEQFIKKKFKKKLGREVHLEKPICFNDKIQWLKLNWRDSVATKCADKYEVRDIVKQKVGEHILNELYGVYDNVDQIDINKLPQSFVLKGTHGSGFNIICKDKNKMDWNIEFAKMKKWLKINYYWEGREWVYKDIKPRIICEKYLESCDGEPPIDYKFMCFNGEPKLSFVCLERFEDLKIDFYDIKWNKMNFGRHYPNSSYVIPKPLLYDEMIKISKKLSNEFPFVRVDLYEIDGKIYFGELTFFPGNGLEEFAPEEYDGIIGDYLDLSTCVINN
ncbi:MAG: ATP-grasp fold amidoligase family protein [Proteocatella sp.]